jgi:hypothetical protein
MPSDIVAYAVDAGSIPKGRFAWACSKDRSAWSSSIDELAEAIAADLRGRRKVALGFECPLFIPVSDEPDELGKARDGECTPETGSKPFTAAAGACATMTGLPSLAWVLRAVHEGAPEAKATTRWDAFESGDAEVFVWEAFVSGKEKTNSHQSDALAAMEAFEKSLSAMSTPTRVTCENPLSLAGTAILWAGMSDDLSLLHDAAVVLRPLPDGGRQ